MAIVAQVSVPIDGGLLLEELREEVVMRLHICLVLVMPDFEQVEAQLVIQMPLHFVLLLGFVKYWYNSLIQPLGDVDS